MRLTPSATSLQAPVESRQVRGHFGIGGIQTAQHSTVSVVRSAEAQPPAAITSLKHKQQRFRTPTEDMGFLHRDEFRYPATFNYSRIMWYLDLVDDIFETFDESGVAGQVGALGKCLVMEPVSPVSDRKRGLPPRSPTLLPRNMPGFLEEHSGRCSERRFSPCFSSVE